MCTAQTARFANTADSLLVHVDPDVFLSKCDLDSFNESAVTCTFRGTGGGNVKMITLLSRVLFTMCHKFMLTDDPKDEICIHYTATNRALCIKLRTFHCYAAATATHIFNIMFKSF